MLFLLVMLNLLIAIIGKAYDEQYEMQDKMDYHALNDCIIELEGFMTYNRNNMMRTHLMYAEYEAGDDLTNYKDSSK
jgi:hypothetical protein